MLAAGVAAQRPVPVSYIGIGSRDYTNNVTATDRVQNLTYPFHHPAIESNMGPVAKVVYVKGQSPSIVVTLRNTASLAIPSQVSFTNFRLETPSVSIPLTVSPSTQSVTVPAMSGGNPGSTTVTISLSTLPSFVALGNIKGTVKATTTQNVYHSNGTLFLLSGTQVMDQGFPEDRVYVTDQTPTGLQNIPWVDLLEYSCLWAYGESGVDSCRRALTEGMFNSGRWYNPGPPNFIVPLTATTYTLYLSDALQFPTMEVDCQDANAILTVAMQSLGVGATNLRVTHRPTVGPDGFWTNMVFPMGSVHATQYAFNFHFITLSDSKVSDATTAHPDDLSGQPFGKPPSNWNLGGYWQTPAGAVIYGLTRSATSPTTYQVVSMHSTTATVVQIL